eukprot:g1916.t1
METSQSTTTRTARNPSWEFFRSLASGGAAGFCVDVALFPIDTLKTRLQSADNYKVWEPKLYRGIYKGLSSAAAGSVPGAALFFCTYDTTKRWLANTRGTESPVNHMLAASAGEVVACTVRVPTENVKTKMQVGMYDSFKSTVRGIKAQGPRPWSGFFVGYWTTVLREIPFSFIQFPIWEKLKQICAERQNSPVAPWQSALFGSFSGAFAAALTTPLDVAKTRLMLLQASDAGGGTPGLVSTLVQIHKAEGAGGLFRGVVPRVTWISIGGAVFFGAYEAASGFLG